MFAASGQLWKSKKQRCLSKLDSLFVLVQGQFIKSEPNKKVQLCKSIAVLVFSMNFLNELRILKFRFWNWSEAFGSSETETFSATIWPKRFDQFLRPTSSLQPLALDGNSLEVLDSNPNPNLDRIRWRFFSENLIHFNFHFNESLSKLFFVKTFNFQHTNRRRVSP